MIGEIYMLTVVLKAEYPAKLKEFLKFANHYFLDQVSTHLPPPLYQVEVSKRR